MSELSFEEFYRESRVRMHRVAYLIVADDGVAADVVQDAYEQAYKRWSHVEHPEGYVRRSVVNGCMSHLRTKARRRTTPRDVLPQGEVIDALDYLGDAIAALPDRPRAVIVLKFYEHLSTDEIAHALQIPSNSVGPTVTRALRTLRKALS